LNLDDRLGLFQPGHQPLVFTAQAPVLLLHRILRLGFSAPLLRCQAVENSVLPLLPPSCQVGRVQSFAAQQRTQLPVLRTSIGFVEDSQLVLGRVPAADRLLWDLRVHTEALAILKLAVAGRLFATLRAAQRRLVLLHPSMIFHPCSPPRPLQ
jgi:hypothetical protein